MPTAAGRNKQSGVNDNEHVQTLIECVQTTCLVVQGKRNIYVCKLTLHTLLTDNIVKTHLGWSRTSGLNGPARPWAT